MKKALLIAALAIILTACKKEPQLVIGNYYNVKGNVFNAGAYQPVCPCRLDSLYIDQTFHMPYAMIFGGQTGTKLVAGGGEEPYDYGQKTETEWYIPQEDLR
jgi:hypothetical protein